MNKEQEILMNQIDLAIESSDKPIWIKPKKHNASNIYYLLNNYNTVYCRPLAPADLLPRLYYDSENNDIVKLKPNWYFELCKTCLENIDKTCLLVVDNTNNIKFDAKVALLNIINSDEKIDLPENAKIVYLDTNISKSRKEVSFERYFTIINQNISKNTRAKQI